MFLEKRNCALNTASSQDDLPHIYYFNTSKIYQF